jgi:hypothetical protein
MRFKRSLTGLKSLQSSGSLRAFTRNTMRSSTSPVAPADQTRGGNVHPSHAGFCAWLRSLQPQVSRPRRQRWVRWSPGIMVLVDAEEA